MVIVFMVSKRIELLLVTLGKVGQNNLILGYCSCFRRVLGNNPVSTETSEIAEPRGNIASNKVYYYCVLHNNESKISLIKAVAWENMHMMGSCYLHDIV